MFGEILSHAPAASFLRHGMEQNPSPFASENALASKGKAKGGATSTPAGSPQSTIPTQSANGSTQMYPSAAAAAQEEVLTPLSKNVEDLSTRSSHAGSNAALASSQLPVSGLPTMQSLQLEIERQRAEVDEYRKRKNLTQFALNRDQVEDCNRIALSMIEKGNAYGGMRLFLRTAVQGMDGQTWHKMSELYAGVAEKARKELERRASLQNAAQDPAAGVEAASGSPVQTATTDALQTTVPLHLQASVLCLMEGEKLGNGPCALELADLYFFDCPVVEHDPDRAFSYLWRAFQAGEKSAAPRIANCYLRGFACERDLTKAVQFLTEAHGNKVDYAAFMLYSLYLGREDPRMRNEQTALHYLREAVKLNESNAILELGELYEKGELGLSQDLQEAINCYMKAAELGNSEALYLMGEVYEDPPASCNLARDLPKSLELFTRAAEKGHLESLKILADKYSKGDGVAVNKEQAVRLLQAAADKGDDESAYRLGVLYRTGNWVERDRKKAREFFVRGAECGNVDALTELAGAWRM